MKNSQFNNEVEKKRRKKSNQKIGKGPGNGQWASLVRLTH